MTPEEEAELTATRELMRGITVALTAVHVDCGPSTSHPTGLTPQQAYTAFCEEVERQVNATSLNDAKVALMCLMTLGGMATDALQGIASAQKAQGVNVDVEELILRLAAAKRDREDAG